MTWLFLLKASVILAHLAITPFFAYLLTLSIASFTYRRKRLAMEESTVRFLFVIPGHNEEAGIAATIASCRRSRYPSGLFDVLAIADNCDDRTARVAQEAGARVVERFDAARKSKGYALESLFRQLADSGEDAKYDAVVIVDADSLVDEDLLGHFARALGEGKDWLQCYYTVSNPDRSWRTRLLTIAFALINGVWSLGQERLGLGAMLRGNGMGFSMRGLKRVPWGAYGLTEDAEFAWRLRIAGERAHFVPEASVRGEMVSRGGPAAAAQRQRWEVGRGELRRATAAPLLRSGRLSPIKKLVYLIDLRFPPLAQLAGVFALSAVANIVAFGREPIPFRMIATLDLLMVASLCVYIMSPFLVMELPWRYAASLAYVPVYVAWKAGVALRRKPTAWVRTRREGI